MQYYLVNKINDKFSKQMLNEQKSTSLEALVKKLEENVKNKE